MTIFVSIIMVLLTYGVSIVLNYLFGWSIMSILTILALYIAWENVAVRVIGEKND